VLGSVAWALTWFYTRCADVQSGGVLLGCARGRVLTSKQLHQLSITRLCAAESELCMLLHLGGLQLSALLPGVEFFKVEACAALGEAARVETRMGTLSL
jgi:hypothetical protein